LFADGHSGRGSNAASRVSMAEGSTTVTQALTQTAIRTGSPTAWNARLIGGMAR
jgi:hypothetical protein